MVQNAAENELGELASYLSTLQERIGRLEESFAALVTAQHAREEKLEHEHHALSLLIQDFADDLVKVEKMLQGVKKETLKLITQFKECARRREFDRLQQRVDAWKGEQYITRDEFKRLLETQSF